MPINWLEPNPTAVPTPVAICPDLDVKNLPTPVAICGKKPNPA